jgi:hypothetical protein
MNALGFEMRLTPADLKTLGALIEAVRDGVTIK